MSFEETMAELEKTVSMLESGEATLEESLALFEKGIKLSKQCQRILDRAEKKVTVLMSDESGKMHEEPFDEAEK